MLSSCFECCSAEPSLLDSRDALAAQQDFQGRTFEASAGAHFKMHSDPKAWYPSSHASSQVLPSPWAPFEVWCACALGVLQAWHVPCESWPQPKRYLPSAQSFAHGLHVLVAAT